IAIDQAGYPAQRCVFIDDRKANIRTAEQVGMTVILMTGIDRVRSELIRLGVKIEPPSLSS
ncbi:HAD-IA family hydrolase, partial [candidate division KSB1 bacterium]|nr:HAD-IA family hydrolase [candidate division KSB1 bacterium]